MATAQDHIDAVGAALIEVEDDAKASIKAAQKVLRATRRLHELMDKAQAEYAKSTGDNVVLFSGGTDKPDPNVPPKP